MIDVHGVGPEYARNGPRVVAASVVRCLPGLLVTDLSMFNSRSVLARALLIASRAVRNWLVWVRHEAHCYIARVAGTDWRRRLWI